MRQMNSRCICAETRGDAEPSARHGNRVQFPDFPGNREADEGTKTTAERREGVPEEEAKSGDLFAP